jgi:hypothetical protein
MPPMPSRKQLRTAWVALLLVLMPLGASAEDWFKFNFNLRFSNRFNIKQNFLNTEGGFFSRGYQELPESPLNLRFNKDELGYSGFLGAGADMYLGQVVSIHLTMDTGEIKFYPMIVYNPKPDCSSGSGDPRCGVTSNGMDIADQAKQTWFVREIFTELGFGRDEWFKFRLGKMLASTGNGFIMDNYALGGMLTADLDLGFEVPVKITLDGLLPNGDFTKEGKRSPYVYLDVAYLLSFFEEVGLFVAWYHDGDDIIGDIVRSIYSDALAGKYPLMSMAVELADVTSRGNLFWVGLRGNKIFDRASLSATAIVEFGSFDFTARWFRPDTQQWVDISASPACLGWMADVSFYYDITDLFTLGGFFLFLSGETDAASRLNQSGTRYNSFLSIYPYITRTNIFFYGGMNQTYSARAFSTSGVNGMGVIAPGLTAGYDITDDLNLRFTSAVLLSHGPHALSQGHFYGWENDLNLQWNVSKYLRILFEADYLWTGDFFDFEKPLEEEARNRTFVNEPNAWKVLIGLDVYY